MSTESTAPTKAPKAPKAPMTAAALVAARQAALAAAQMEAERLQKELEEIAQKAISERDSAMAKAIASFSELVGDVSPADFAKFANWYAVNQTTAEPKVIETVTGRRGRYNDDTKAKALAAIAAGATLVSVSAELGVSLPTLSKWRDVAAATATPAK